MKPAMNSRGVILDKDLFVQKIDLKNKKRDNNNHGKKMLLLRRFRQKRLRAGTVLLL